MSALRYVSFEEAVDIHDQIIEKTGGKAANVTDPEELRNIMDNIRDDEKYPSLTDKMTELFYDLCTKKCFETGNTRTAVTLPARFLIKNGYISIALSFLKEMESICYHVSGGNIDRELLHDITDAVLQGQFETDEGLKLAILNAISHK